MTGSWISWYVQPWGGPTFYLTPGYKEGWAYTIDKDRAHRFETKAEALARTPSYDGSGGIEKRSGVTFDVISLLPAVPRPWNPAFREVWNDMTVRERQKSFLIDLVILSVGIGIILAFVL